MIAATYRNTGIDHQCMTLQLKPIHSHATRAKNARQITAHTALSNVMQRIIRLRCSTSYG